MSCCQCLTPLTSLMPSLFTSLHSMTSHWYIVAGVLVTSQSVCSYFSLGNVIFLGVDNSTTALVFNKKQTARIEKFATSLREFIRQKSRKCPLTYLKQRWTEHHQDTSSSTSSSTSSPRHISKLPALSIPEQFNRTFRNPCWYEEDKLYCLPYYFMAGFPKCASTDLYLKMGMHPQILVGHKKEPQWWSRKRFGREGYPIPKPDPNNSMSFPTYLDFYTTVSQCMEQAARVGIKRPVPLITGDATTSTLWENRFTPNFDPGELHSLIADDIRHYLPQAKIIVIMRDPVQRSLSDYIHVCKMVGCKTPPSPDDFHEKVQESVQIVTECLRNHTLRRCVYTSGVNTKARLWIGIYSVYLRDWYRIFPKHQIHVLRTEDFQASPRTELQKIFHFLQLDALDEWSYAYIGKRPKANKAYRHLDMLPKTKQLLRDFYAPFNKDLAKLLGNDDYLWDQT